MFDLTKSVSQPGPLVALIVGVVALIIAIIALSQLLTTRKQLRGVLRGSDGEPLDVLLERHFTERKELESYVRQLELRTQDLEDRMKHAKRHVGLVKYDAFDDIGGNQSFALAIYDDSGNGVVISSIVGRMDCRVYAKPLLKLTSERALGEEEERAIREAKVGGPKMIIS
jgi:hypothetical protein